MDYELNSDQGAILEAIDALLAQYAGPARAIELAAKGEYDTTLEAALDESGFAEVALGDETGFLEAALVVEAIARAGGVVAAGARLLVAPGTLGRAVPAPVALATGRVERPIRYGAHAKTLLIADGDEAGWVQLEPGEIVPVPSGYGYPVGRGSESLLGRAERLGPGSGPRMRAWWRVALAAETVGTMSAALEVTVAYLKQRRQFGRAIGSFQAVQHRLAECAVSVQGARWLMLEAAAHGAPREGAAVAAAHATAAAAMLFRETHQLSGAIGYTREHDLHVFSMRLQALRLELEGAAAQQRAVARARWVSPT